MGLSVTLADLIEFLERGGVPFAIEGKAANLDDSRPLRPASLFAPIQSGLYFVTKTAPLESLIPAQSVILSDAPPIVPDDNTWIVVPSPQLMMFQFLSRYRRPIRPGIHPTSIIEDSEVDPSAHIGPFCQVNNAVIGPDVVICSHCWIGEQVVLERGVHIGPNCSLGVDGLSWMWSPEGDRVWPPQCGGVVVRQDAWIGSGISIVRGSTSESTEIGSRTLVAHGTCIGHGASLGEECHFANNVSIGGNAVVGHHSFFGSGASIATRCQVGPACVVGAGAVVTRNFDEPNLTLVGVPAKVLHHQNYMTQPRGVPGVVRHD